ncbi:MAG: cytochrome c biogenesis protein/thioredoxin [Deltaproteobacteria bacterium]|nr:cytochrome c biogenesis protein/thioredoxin [Deltaproteobacteria bacterium]
MNLAAGTIFVAGLLTFASPCVLPLIPIYLGVLLGGSLEDLQGMEAAARARGRWRLLLNGVLFVAGFSVVFILLGLSVSTLGGFLARNRLLFQQLGGLLVFVFGLKLLGLLRVEALERERRFAFRVGRGIGPGGAFLMGLTFAFGWTPCIGPVLGAVLTFTATAASDALQGGWLLLVYALGIGLPLLLLAALAQPGVRLLERVKRHIPRLEKATGALLVAMAVLMVTDSTSILAFDAFRGRDELSRDTARALGTTRSYGSTMTSAGAGDPAASCSEEAGCAMPEAAVFDPSFQGTFQLPKGPAVIDFYRPDCPACLAVVPILDSLEETCAARGMSVFRLDVSDPENRAFADGLGVLGTPTLIFVDEHGAEASRLIGGAATWDAVEKILDVISGGECRDFRRFQDG